MLSLYNIRSFVLLVHSTPALTSEVLHTDCCLLSPSYVFLYYQLYHTPMETTASTNCRHTLRLFTPSEQVITTSCSFARQVVGKKVQTKAAVSLHHTDVDEREKGSLHGARVLHVTNHNLLKLITMHNFKFVSCQKSIPASGCAQRRVLCLKLTLHHSEDRISTSAWKMSNLCDLHTCDLQWS